MNKACTTLAALAFLALAPACDPGMEDFDEDEAEAAAEDIWARELVVGDFELTLVTTYTASNPSCTTTITHAAVGNGDLAVGSIAVGIPDPEGNLVVGGIGLAGHLVRSEDNTPDDCWGADASVESETAAGTLSLKAPRPGDPMTLTLASPSAGTIEEVVLDTTVFAADALYEPGTAETLRLQKTVHIADDGDSGRDVEVEVDLVVDIVVEE